MATLKVTFLAAALVLGTVTGQTFPGHNLHDPYDQYRYNQYNGHQHSFGHHFNNDDFDAHPRYGFAYGVEDPSTGDSKTHEEQRDGDRVIGRYSLLEPDGARRVVDYTADSANGFNALVHRVENGSPVVPRPAEPAQPPVDRSFQEGPADNFQQGPNYQEPSAGTFQQGRAYQEGPADNIQRGSDFQEGPANSFRQGPNYQEVSAGPFDQGRAYQEGPAGSYPDGRDALFRASYPQAPAASFQDRSFQDALFRGPAGSSQESRAFQDGSFRQSGSSQESRQFQDGAFQQGPTGSPQEARAFQNGNAGFFQEGRADNFQQDNAPAPFQHPRFRHVSQNN